MPLASPSIGRDTVASINTPFRNGTMQQPADEPRRPVIPIRP